MNRRIMLLFSQILPSIGIAILILTVSLISIQSSEANYELGIGTGDCKSTLIKCDWDTCTTSGCNSPSDCLCR